MMDLHETPRLCSTKIYDADENFLANGSTVFLLYSHYLKVWFITASYRWHYQCKTCIMPLISCVNTVLRHRSLLHFFLSHQRTKMNALKILYKVGVNNYHLHKFKQVPMWDSKLTTKIYEIQMKVLCMNCLVPGNTWSMVVGHFP